MRTAWLVGDEGGKHRTIVWSAVPSVETMIEEITAQARPGHFRVPEVGRCLHLARQSGVMVGIVRSRMDASCIHPVCPSGTEAPASHQPVAAS
jgi:hypothetical protein